MKNNDTKSSLDELEAELKADNIENAEKVAIKDEEKIIVEKIETSEMKKDENSISIQETKLNEVKEEKDKLDIGYLERKPNLSLADINKESLKILKELDSLVEVLKERGTVNQKKDLINKLNLVVEPISDVFDEENTLKEEIKLKELDLSDDEIVKEVKIDRNVNWIDWDNSNLKSWLSLIVILVSFTAFIVTFILLLHIFSKQ